MKKLSIILTALAILACFSAPGFAMLRKDLQAAKGTVTYINSARTEITIKDNASGKDVTFSSKGVSSDISTGSTVLVMYKVGTTNAKSVRLVVPRARRAGGMANNAMKPASTPSTSKYGY